MTEFGARAAGTRPLRTRAGTSVLAAEAALDAELEAIVELERSIRAAQAEQLRRIERAHGWAHAVERVHEGSSSTDLELATRAFVAELATALGVHERTSGSMVADAQRLQSLPETLAALASGSIGLAHARTIIDATQGMPQPLVDEFEVTALDRAARMTNASLRRSLRGLRERLLQEPLEHRQARNALDRRVCLEPEPDGMAWLSFFLEGERATAIRARLDALAGASVDERTTAQRALDIAADLLLGNHVVGGDVDAGNRSVGGPSDGRPPLGVVIPRVYVTVPLMTLLGHSDEPAELDGYGPIDAETARELAAHAPSFQRILTHPETGAYLSFGRTSYRVPADLAGYLKVRDGGCRFPGCGRRAVASDIDHTVDWAFDGRTEHDNLAHLCRKHHRLKHRTAWRMTQESGGVIRWDSPPVVCIEVTPSIRSSPGSPLVAKPTRRPMWAIPRYRRWRLDSERWVQASSDRSPRHLRPDPGVGRRTDRVDAEHAREAHDRLLLAGEQLHGARLEGTRDQVAELRCAEDELGARLECDLGSVAAARLRQRAGSDGSHVERRVHDDGDHRDPPDRALAHCRVTCHHIAHVEHVLGRGCAGRDIRPERRAQGDGQRIGRDDLALGRVAERGPSPAFERDDDGLERAAERS